MKHFGEHPSWIYLNHEHFCEILASEHIWSYVQVDWQTGKPRTILGMQYKIEHDRKEIEVHSKEKTNGKTEKD